MCFTTLDTLSGACFNGKFIYGIDFYRLESKNLKFEKNQNFGQKMQFFSVFGPDLPAQPSADLENMTAS